MQAAEHDAPAELGTGQARASWEEWRNPANQVENRLGISIP